MKTRSEKSVDIDQAAIDNQNSGLSETEQAELIHSEKLHALGLMSAGIAHEINNPLNYAILGVELLKSEGREMLAPEFESVIRDIEDGLVRIKNIVQDLKVYSRKDTADHDVETFLAGDAVAAAIRLVTAGYEHIEVSTMLNSPFRVAGDLSSIIQVLINLITNAADSVKNKWDDEGGKIDVLGSIVDDRYFFQVADNGEGISQSQISRIFTPFYTTKSARSGTGLGMGICRAIVERHGGEITVESSLGYWTSVSFSLPYYPDEAYDFTVRT